MEVKIYNGTPDFVTDERRDILDTYLAQETILPFPLRQFKTIIFSRQAVESEMVVGNHYHPEETNRQEFFVFIGKVSKGDNPPVAAIFRYRNAESRKVHEVKMRLGDACLVPAGYSHAFMPLREGVIMIGVSNKPYDAADDVKDKLFGP